MSEESDPVPAVRQEAEEQELCTQCLTANRPGTHFCRGCGSPLTAYAATGPLEHVFAEGHVYRRATEQPQRFIVVFGMWLIFGIMALIGAVIAFLSWGTGDPLTVLLGIGMLAISVAMIVKTTRSYRRRRVGSDESSG